jgi:hypothetical protein
MINTTCPICGENIELNVNLDDCNDLKTTVFKSLVEHIAQDHKEITKNIIAIFNACNYDYGYFISCVKCEQDKILTEEYYNS